MQSISLVSFLLLVTIVGSARMQALGQAGLGGLLGGGLGLGGNGGLLGGLTNGLVPMQNGLIPNGLMGQNMMLGQNSLQGLTQTLSALLNGLQNRQGMAMNQQMNQQDLAQILSRLSRSSLELLQRIVDSISRSLTNGQYNQMQQQNPGILNGFPLNG